MIALLPMKGNSERVPNKNIKNLNGIPLFYYIADTLKKSGLFSILAINTDSKNISNFAKSRYGDWVEIIKRPKRLCGDYVSMNDIIAHDVEYFGIDNEYFQTHSTNPFLKAKTILKANKKYTEHKEMNECNSIFSVNAIHTRLYDKDLNPINHDLKKLERTQDLEIIYEENSNFYFFSGKVFNEGYHRIGSQPMPFVMDGDPIESLDIDNMSDWMMAESYFK